MVRSVRLAEAGAALLVVSFVALFVAMPRFTPFEFLHCPAIAPAGPQGAQCFNSLNPAYPLVFLVSIAGTVVLLFGVFGGGFVLSPVVVVGMIALEYGLSGVVSRSLSTETGITANPAVFSPLIAIGVLALCIQALRLQGRRTQVLQR